MRPELKESRFRFYEPFLKLAVDRLPEPTAFRPGDYNLSTTTFIGRIRDAKKSLQVNGWNTNVGKKFEGLFFGFLDNDKVIALHVDHKIDLTTPPKVEAVPFRARVELKEFDFTKMDGTARAGAVCELAHNRLICAPIRVRMHSEDVEHLSKCYDIDLEKQSDGSYILT